MPSATRPYRQVARAAATEQTRARILDAFAEAIERTWIEEITLDEIAAEAGTTRQTVIRLFGGKEGLLTAVAERIGQQVVLRRALPAGPLAHAVAQAVVKDYEVSGDMVLRLLAQEGRYPVVTTLLDIGRRSHREWVETSCAAALAARPPAARRRLLDQLVVATDVYTWKLLRRDMCRPAAEVEAILADMLGKLLEEEIADA